MIVQCTGCLLMMLLFFAMPRGEAAELKAKDWYASLQQEGFLEGSFPLRVIFLQQEADAYRPLPLDKKAFQSFGYLELVDFRELPYFHLLNQRPWEKARELDLDQDELFTTWMRSSYVDTIVLNQAAEQRWVIFHKDKDGKPERIFKGRAPDALDAQAVYAWLLDKIGYTGVVLRAKDNLFLVLFLRRDVPKNQVMAIENSADDFLIPPARIKGSAILQLLDSWEDVGIYEGLLVKNDDKAQVKPGTKLILAKPDGKKP